MPDSALVTLLTGAGVAGVFCLLFVCGLVYPKHVVDDLKAERDYERQRAEANQDRADTAVAATQATKDMLSALQTGVAFGQRRQEPRSFPVANTPEVPGRGPT